MFSGAVPQESDAGATFAELGLGERTLAGLEEIGFERPTPIQARAIPSALAGRDVVGLAQTGSGKTAAFILPMVERLGRRPGVRGLVMCPTREIALQTHAFAEVAGAVHGMRTACLIGGVAFGPQLDALRADPDLVIATPGRLWDHFGRRNVRFDQVEMLVLDEGDHMLDLGFLPQIHRVLEQVPEDRQMLVFSATLPPPIQRLVDRFLSDPVTVDLRPTGQVAAGIEHRLYLVDHDDMRRALMALVEREPGSMLVFLRRKVDAEWACRQIQVSGHPVERIHSDRSQRQRVQALSGLRAGDHRILVATDIAARGLDLPIVRHVVNFGLPDNVEDYVHRAGRTARGAMKGVVSSIGTWQDKETIEQIERVLGHKLPRRTLDGIKPWRERKKKIRGRTRGRRRLR
ncbi:MAG: DEAD/DEAH box helicase [Thermoanaerobaculia bacterium]|nr:DEAD/DEAH box helicase [Thermoanaerobaculia bacterium]